MERVRRAATAVLIGVAALLSLPPAARAHGDLASEYLEDHSLFLPVRAKVDPEAVTRLATVVREADKAGFRIKVAVIAQPADLGFLSQFDRRPQMYAEFLGLDLASVYLGRVLVAMPNGFGYSVNGQPDRRASRALNGLAGPGRDATRQVETASVAVRRLAAAGGHRIVLSKEGGGSEAKDRITIAAAATAGIALLAGVVLFRRQRGTRG
jgi:hypothetical protein